MGKRKSSKKPQTRVKQVLDKSFRCIFCAHQGSVTCKMDNKEHIGRLDCKDCGQSYSMNISHLDAPVDVYSSWIDAASEANSAGGGRGPAASSSGLQRQNDDPERGNAAAAASTKRPSSKKKQKKRARDEDEDEASEEDDGDFDPRQQKKGKKSRSAERDDEDEGGQDEEEEEEAVESEDDLPDMDISKDKNKSRAKKSRVVEDEDDE